VRGFIPTDDEEKLIVKFMADMFTVVGGAGGTFESTLKIENIRAMFLRDGYEEHEWPEYVANQRNIMALQQEYLSILTGKLLNLGEPKNRIYFNCINQEFSDQFLFNKDVIGCISGKSKADSKSFGRGLFASRWPSSVEPVYNICDRESLIKFALKPDAVILIVTDRVLAFKQKIFSQAMLGIPDRLKISGQAEKLCDEIFRRILRLMSIDGLFGIDPAMGSKDPVLSLLTLAQLESIEPYINDNIKESTVPYPIPRAIM